MPGWWHILFSLRLDIVAEIVVLNLSGSLKSEVRVESKTTASRICEGLPP